MLMHIRKPENESTSLGSFGKKNSERDFNQVKAVLCEGEKKMTS